MEGSILHHISQSDDLTISDEMRRVYHSSAMQGSSDVPTSAEAEVQHHYVCFVGSEVDLCLYELDGDREGPVNTGLQVGRNQCLLSNTDVINFLKDYCESKSSSLAFSVMAMTLNDAT